MTQRGRENSQAPASGPQSDLRLAPLGALKATFLFAVGSLGGWLVTWVVAMLAGLQATYGDFSVFGATLIGLAPVAFGGLQVWFWASRDRRVWCYWVGWVAGSAGLHAFVLIALPAFA